MSVADLAGVRVIGAQARGVVWLRVLVRTFLAIVHVGLVIAVVASVKNVFASGDWNYSDGIPLYFILRARDGLLIYPDFQQLPYVTLSYWPLYIELVGLLSRFLTLSTYGTLYLARGVSLAGSLVVVAAIVGLARLCGARRTGALVGGGLFLLTYEYHPWAYAVRTDLLALGLIMAGTWTCLRWRTPRGAACSAARR